MPPLVRLNSSLSGISVENIAIAMSERDDAAIILLR